MMDELIRREEERRWWCEDPAKFRHVTPDEIPKLIELARLEKEWENDRR
jgi:hypothetical protein